MSNPQTKAEIVISAVDKATAILTTIGERLDGIVKPAGNVASAFARLYDATGIGNVKSAIGGLASSLRGVALASVGIAGVYSGTIGSIVGLGIHAAETADKIGDLAERYGVASKDIQVFGASVVLGGGEIEDAAASLGKLNRSMSQARAGSKEALAAFNAAGISLKDLKSKTAPEVIQKMADAFMHSSNEGAKQVIVQQLMGKSGSVMIGTLNQGTKALKEFDAQMVQDGRIFTQSQIRQADVFDRVYKRMQGTIEGLKNALGLQLIPVIQPLIENMQKWIIANREMIQGKFLQLIERLPKALEVGKEVFIALWDISKKLGAAFKVIYTILGPTGASLGVIVTLFSPVILAAGQLTYQLGRVVWIIANITGVVPLAIRALNALWAVMAANPVFLIAAAIAWLAVMVVTNWDDIANYISDAWNRIKSIFKVNFFSGLIQLWLEDWQLMANSIVGIIKAILPDKWIPESMRNFQFTYANDNAQRLTASQIASQRAEVGGTLKIQIDSQGNAKVTELKKSGAMDIDVYAGLVMAGG